MVELSETKGNSITNVKLQMEVRECKTENSSLNIQFRDEIFIMYNPEVLV